VRFIAEKDAENRLIYMGLKSLTGSHLWSFTLWFNRKLQNRI